MIQKNNIRKVGHKQSLETRKKISINNSHYWKGKKKSEEIHKKVWETRWKNILLGKSKIITGKDHHRYGTHITLEHKKKISLGNKGKIVSERTREKLRLALLNSKLSDVTKQKIRFSHLGKLISEETKQKIRDNAKNNTNYGMRGKHQTQKAIERIHLPHTKESIEKYKKWRKTFIFPVKDTSIEVKIQNFLKQLNIEFFTHQYIKEIEHGYQCDILIPVQEGITKKTIIECFGTYWHKYPLAREIDIQRCNELREKGFRVLVFWENEIKVMGLNDLKKEVTK